MSSDAKTIGIGKCGGFVSLRIALTLAGAIAACPVSATTQIIPGTSLVSGSGLYTDAIGGGYGGEVIMTGGGNGANVGQSRSDDGFSGPIDLGFALPFFGSSYTQFWANNNGNISFNGGVPAYSPFGLTETTNPIIAPFFSDVDTRGAGSGVLHLRNDRPDETILTWDKVGSFSTNDQNLNTFQLIIRGPDANIAAGEGNIGFFYGPLAWETGDSEGFASAGFSDGAGNARLLEGSDAAGLNTRLANNHIWFNLDLTPVAPVPVPAAIWLLGSALLGLVSTRKRR